MSPGARAGRIVAGRRCGRVGPRPSVFFRLWTAPAAHPTEELALMERMGRARTSLFARMSLIFGLLVAVPLAVSGLILSLVARNSVLDSGTAMSRIGEQAVYDTRS